MSTDDQADAYLTEARLTHRSAEAIYDAAADENQDLWAQVVKNAYDAIEQAVSAAIAAEDENVPRRHPAKINRFIDLYEPSEELEDTLLHWLRRRSDSQYVDIRAGKVTIPHEQFDQDDAETILDNAGTVIEYVRNEIELPP